MREEAHSAARVAPGSRRVVVIGAGFAGLEVARALGRKGIEVTVIDRTNHHLFQPLLYQVATAALSSTDIAEPVRKILRAYPSVEVLYGAVESIDAGGRSIVMGDGERISYDILVLAAGARTSYFGNDAWAEHAHGLKSAGDAVRLRSRLLLSFEQAERTRDEAERQRLLTVAIAGGGPTGVELAGSIAELARYTLHRDFRNIRPEAARILLIEGADRLLGGFSQEASDFAARRLERLGVDVRLGNMIENVEADAITLAGERIPVGLTVWAAGMEASPLAQTLGAKTDKGGRIHVNTDCSIDGLEGVYALGDIAAMPGADGKPLPGLAQVARQQGIHLGRALAAHLESGTPVPPFAYRGRGNTAIVGRGAAVFEQGRLKLRGWFAWLSWAIIHVYLLTGFQNRMVVAARWLWRYLTYERGARVVSGELPGEAPRGGTEGRHG